MPSQSDFVDSIRRDSDGFAEAAEVAGPQAAVAACPDWTVADLVWHLRETHYCWRVIVEDGLRDPNGITPIERPPDFAQLLADFRAGAGRMADVLESADPSRPVWTWAPQQEAAFVIRHQVQEAAVHRWDAEQAAGRDFSIDPVMAADAVDEFLELIGTAYQAEGAAPLGGTVHLHATDTPGEWVVTEDEAGDLRMERAHRKADVALRATASDLLLMLYRRVTPDRGEVFGDGAILHRLLNRRDLS
ncbi:MAG: maleylpyruvate isomerase family mycothiol-dependent enzyme [Egibacteraceae bacterium]